MKFTEECDVYEETCFSQKNVYKWVKQRFATMSLSWKDSPLSGNMLLSGKEKVPGAAVGKEGHADRSFYVLEPYHSWLPLTKVKQ